MAAEHQFLSSSDFWFHTLGCFCTYVGARFWNKNARFGCNDIYSSSCSFRRFAFLDGKPENGDSERRTLLSSRVAGLAFYRSLLRLTVSWQTTSTTYVGVCLSFGFLEILENSMRIVTVI